VAEGTAASDQSGQCAAAAQVSDAARDLSAAPQVRFAERWVKFFAIIFSHLYLSVRYFLNVSCSALASELSYYYILE
jgi:hypothetical protein